MDKIFLSFLTGYVLGSIPTAYILLKKSTGIDITKNGSGNVGAMNSYIVSKSKITGAKVLAIDFLKGIISVFLAGILFGKNFEFMMAGLIGAVLSHCYSPWIKFKGGRGLATAAGGALILSVPILIIWGIIWTVSFGIKRNIHFSNITASSIMLLLPFTISVFLMKYTSPLPGSSMEFSILVSLLFTIILSKHIEPIKEIYLSQKNLRIKEDESI